MENQTKVFKRYTERFKQRVVSEVVGGVHSKLSAARFYGITGSTTIDRWCRRYGGAAYEQSRYIDLPLDESSVAVTKKQEPLPDDPKLLRQRIAELETQLRASELRREAFETAIQIAQRDLGIDVLKKSATKQSPR